MRLTRGRETQPPATKSADTYNLYGTGGLLSYDGQDMHHNIYLSSAGASTCAIEVSVDANADTPTWVTIVPATTVGAAAAEVSVYATGTTVDLPFKFVRIVIAGADVKVAVDSFGTEIR